MKRLISVVSLALLAIVPIAQAAPKKINVQAMQLLTTVGTPDEVSGAVLNGSSIIVFGTKYSQAYARALDSTGKELWNLFLDQSVASVATAAVVDKAGDIWIAGSTPLASGAISSTPRVSPINPDNVVLPPSVFQEDLQAVAIWKVTPTGVLKSTYTLPTNFVLFPTAIAVDNNGASIVGIAANEKGNAGFLVNTDPSGIFTNLLQIGGASTTADAVVRHGDGSFTVAGSSSESIAGKKLAGITDGILIKITNSLKITGVVRSSVSKGKRVWNSATSSLLLAGEVIAGGKSESALTKFSSTFVPKWTYRFASTGQTLSASSTHAFFISTGAISQLNWNPKAPTPLLLTFDPKGVITGAYKGAAGQKEVVSLLISKALGVLALTSGPESVSIFTPLPR